ncbi:MAG: type II toxin-antitoxin system HigB family toxin [Alphaproteobacteria bacterium]|nr:type II toxin-antitoxin system HigB family toxin [Alphaproteobacteria bacterium]
MRIIARRTLRAFWDLYPDSEEPLKAWFKEAEGADWATPAAVKAMYGNASILKDSRVVFNIGGNKYRLIVKFNFDYRIGYIRFVGSHKEYDEIDANSV